MINLTRNKLLAPVLTPIEHRSLTKTNACGGIELIAEKTNTFVYRFACVLKAKPERPPVIVLSTACTESEARANLSKAFSDKMRLIWAGRMPRNSSGVRHA